MKRIVIWFLLDILVFAAAASAQSLSPVIGEGGRGKLKGAFTISNPEVKGMVTTVDVKSATFSPDGSVAYRPLDADVEVHMEDTSARIGPRQSHVFYYSIECHNAKSCIVVFLPSSTFGRAANGMQVRVVLPHSVYVCTGTSAKGCRARVRAESGIPDGK